MGQIQLHPGSVAPHVSPALFDQFARGWRGYVLIALIALASSLFGAGRLQVMDADEARYAQATRQMIESSDYGHIRLQGAERNRKPIGIHWLQAAAVNAADPLTDRLNTIWPYRIPSALGVVLAAVATLWAGAALLTQRQAFFGAALFSAGVLVGFEGMTAKTDAVLLGFTTLAMAALARLKFAAASPLAGEAPAKRAEGGRANDQTSDQRSAPHVLTPGPRGGGGKILALIFWFALACGVMIKGPVTPLVALLTLGALALWERRLAWMKPLLWWPGPLLAAAIIAPWFVFISGETNGAFFAAAFADIAPKIAGGDDTHLGLPGYHLFLLPFLIFPATYALPAAARLTLETIRAPRDADAHASFRFLICWAAPTILFFELMATKLPHYVLPAYPAVALLCGAGLGAMLGRAWRTAHPAGLVAFAVTGAVIVALMATSATFMPGDFASDLRRAISTALIGASIVGAAAAALIMLRRPAARAAVLVACALVLSFSLRERLLPEAQALNVSSEVVAALQRARLTPRDDRPLWVVGYTEPSLVFLTRTDIRLATAADAAAHARVGDALVVEGRALQDITTALAARDLAFASNEAPVRGLALGRGERVSLHVGEVLSASAEAADGQPRNP